MEQKELDKDCSMHTQTAQTSDDTHTLLYYV